MNPDLTEKDITVEVFPNVTAECLVHDCYASIPSGDLYVERIGSETHITEPESITTPNLIANCREHHMNLGGWHNKFQLLINSKKIGTIAVSSACSSGMVNLD